MPAGLRSVLLVLCLSVAANAQVRTLAVYPKNIQGLDPSAANVLEQELKRLLSPAGIDVAWRPSGSNPGDNDAEMLVVGSFQGQCSVMELGDRASVPARSNTLGETHVSANGRILPFFRVECGRIIQGLAPILRNLNVPLRHTVLGRALARVFAHEIYHVVTQAKDHDVSGVAKASLSEEDLVAEHFDFAPATLDRLQLKPAGVAHLSSQVLPR